MVAETVLLDQMLSQVKKGVGFLIRTDGTITPYNTSTSDGSYNFRQLKDDIGASYGELVYLSKEVIMVCDEEGLLMEKPINVHATVLYREKFHVNSIIVGDVVICHTTGIK